MLKSARDKISLDELNIKMTRIRRAANGGMIIEILGQNEHDRADALADKLKTILKDQAKVVRPMVRDEIRLIGLDDSVSKEEVMYVVAQNGNCKEEDVKTGPIRQMNNGLFTVWVQCPLSAAIKTANMKKIKIGWTLARVDLLEKKSVQCFKCWRYGHVRLSCTSKEDHSGSCFKCGEADHHAQNSLV